MRGDNKYAAFSSEQKKHAAFVSQLYDQHAIDSFLLFNTVRTLRMQVLDRVLIPPFTTRATAASYICT